MPTYYEDLLKTGKLDETSLAHIEFPIVFSFIKPLKGSKLESIELREPTIGDIRDAQKKDGDIDKNLHLLALLSDRLSPTDAADITPRDYFKLLELLTPFLM